MNRYRRRGQALVEFALALPIFVLFVFALIQLGLVFVQYYSEAELALRASRWLAIHPNTSDADFAQWVREQALPGQVVATPTLVQNGTAAQPSVYRVGKLTVRFTPCLLSGSTCAHSDRAPGRTLFVEMEYDVSDWLFLPTTFRLGLTNVSLPTALPPYRVYKMVE